MTPEQIRASVLKQLDLPLPSLLALEAQPQTPAEQRKRVQVAERALWGASVVMSAALSMPTRARPEPGDTVDPVEQAWWRLHDATEKVRQTWQAEMRAEWDADRHRRRAAIYAEVAEKMKKTLGVVIEDGDDVYGRDLAETTDERPVIKHALDAKWSREMGWLMVRDPFSGEWHEIQSKEAPRSWRDMANDNKRRMIAEAQSRA